MRIFKITHSDKVIDFIAAERPLKAASIVCLEKGYDIDDIQDSEIEEIPSKRWDDYYLIDDEEGNLPLMNKLDGKTFADWLKINDNEPGFIATTEN